MGLYTSENKHFVELSVPLLDDISSLVLHLRKMADKLEAIQNQKLLKGFESPMTEVKEVSEIIFRKKKDCFNLTITLRKNWDFTLRELEKVIDTKPIKTKAEILEEIEAAKRTIENHRKAYNDGDIPMSSLEHALTDNQATIAALLWVLGENDRYD